MNTLKIKFAIPARDEKSHQESPGASGEAYQACG